MGGRQQPKDKPRQEEGDCFLGETEGGATTLAAGHWARVQFASPRRHTERQVDSSRSRDCAAVIQHAVRDAGAALARHADHVAARHIFRATVISRILYAAPSWSGMCSAANHVRLDSLLRRSKRLGYCRSDMSVISELFNTADDDFFQCVETKSNHVLRPYLPQHTVTPYQLRTRPHNITLINKTKFFNNTDVIIRMIYKFSY